jgi:hypothetical protein
VSKTSSCDVVVRREEWNCYRVDAVGSNSTRVPVGPLCASCWSKAKVLGYAPEDIDAFVTAYNDDPSVVAKFAQITVGGVAAASNGMPASVNVQTSHCQKAIVVVDVEYRTEAELKTALNRYRLPKIAMDALWFVELPLGGNVKELTKLFMFPLSAGFTGLKGRLELSAAVTANTAVLNTEAYVGHGADIYKQTLGNDSSTVSAWDFFPV